MSEEFTEFNLPTTSYAAFDATSLRDLIITRLTEKNVFTDQVFEGSNISSIIDIVAYSYHVLLFYLNRTSSESMFTETQINENINRIVKLLNYNPTGIRTATLTFDATGSDSLSRGTYTIPRYSFINIGGIKYSIDTDISFTKTVSTTELIASIGTNHLLYQGSYEEYPLQTANGEEFELITLGVDSSVLVDSFGLDVYVKSNSTGKWSQYIQTDSLFLELPGALVYEKRLNENGRYEIKFGNDITGKQLASGDLIAIYYLKSDGTKGTVGANVLSNHKMTLYTSPQLNDILSDVKSLGISYIPYNTVGDLLFKNVAGSTTYTEKETVDEIRANAPPFFAAQSRLVTAKDYQAYIDKTFGNILIGSKVVNNDDYINGHLKYVFDKLSLKEPNLESRVMYNQVNFSSSTNFNNVYVYAVPKFQSKTSGTVLVNFLSPAQKNIIAINLEKLKTLNSEPVIIDPVYMALDIFTQSPGETISTSNLSKSRMTIVKDRKNHRDGDLIKAEAAAIIKKHFGNTSRLGQLIDTSSIYSDLIQIVGVKDIYMTRTDNTSVKVSGITLLLWNPVYEKSDMSVVSQNLQLPYYKFPYLHDESCLTSKIIVISE